MIICEYNDDGCICGFDNTDLISNSVLTGNVIEVTKEQQEAFFGSPLTHGVIDGEFSDQWVRVDSAEEVESWRVRDINLKAEAAIQLIRSDRDAINLLADGLIALTKVLISKGVIQLADLPTKAVEIATTWDDNVNPILEAAAQAVTDGTLAEDFNP